MKNVFLKNGNAISIPIVGTVPTKNASILLALPINLSAQMGNVSIQNGCAILNMIAKTVLMKQIAESEIIPMLTKQSAKQMNSNATIHRNVCQFHGNATETSKLLNFS